MIFITFAVVHAKKVMCNAMFLYNFLNIEN